MELRRSLDSFFDRLRPRRLLDFQAVLCMDETGEFGIVFPVIEQVREHDPKAVKGRVVLNLEVPCYLGNSESLGSREKF
jgi:hypothetical protein